MICRDDSNVGSSSSNASHLIVSFYHDEHLVYDEAQVRLCYVVTVDL